jgi:hypothetical protein
MPAKNRNRKLPSEINWLRKNTNEISHNAFFDFFKTYSGRRANTGFKEIIKYMEDNEKKAEVLENYNKWKKKSKAAGVYWSQRIKAITAIVTPHHAPLA